MTPDGTAVDRAALPIVNCICLLDGDVFTGENALPGSPSACRDAWDGILVHQLDNRFRPCNFVELMPRLMEK